MLQSQSYLEKGTINQLQSPTSSCSLDIYFSFTKDISNPKHFHPTWVEFWVRTSLTLLDSGVQWQLGHESQRKQKPGWPGLPNQLSLRTRGIKSPPKWSRRCQCSLPAVPGLQGAAPAQQFYPAEHSALSSCLRIPGNNSLHLVLLGDATLRQFYFFILGGTACTLIILWISHRNVFLDSSKDALGTCNPGRKAPGTAHFQVQFI